MTRNRKRLEKEFLYLKKNPLYDEEVFPEEGDKLDKIRVVLTGAKGSKYEKEIIEFKIEFPKEYPFKPPRIEFIRQKGHPLLGKYVHNSFYSLKHKN